jgi:hypothetical protein
VANLWIRFGFTNRSVSIFVMLHLIELVLTWPHSGRSCWTAIHYASQKWS